MITTNQTEQFPEIDWEIGDLLDFDSEERMRIYNANGEDANRHKYSGSAYYVCGQFEEIKDIELLKY